MYAIYRTVQSYLSMVIKRRLHCAKLYSPTIYLPGTTDTAPSAQSPPGQLHIQQNNQLTHQGKAWFSHNKNEIYKLLEVDVAATVADVSEYKGLLYTTSTEVLHRGHRGLRPSHSSMQPWWNWSHTNNPNRTGPDRTGSEKKQQTQRCNYPYNHRTICACIME